MNLSRRKICNLVAAAVFAAAALWGIFSGTVADFFVDDTRFSKEIAQAASRHGVPPQLVRAVIFQESRFNPKARGKKGEYGLMQVLPSGAVADWARVHKVVPPGPDELFEPAKNLEIGCWYLGRALRKWQNYTHGVELALAQYNAGATRAKRWKPETQNGEVLPRVTLPGTKRYIAQITKRYRSYSK